METKENLSEHDSFIIINEMIATAKHAIADNSFHYLLWGWLVFAASALNFFLLVVVKTNYNWLPWPVLMFSGGIIAMIYSAREKRREKVKTYVDRFLGYAWTAVLAGIFLTLLEGSRLGYTTVYPGFMILYGIGLYISGRAFGFVPLVIGSICCWVCAVISCFVTFDIQLVLLALSVLLGYIIPGHILKLKYRYETAR
jgi:hypothetical protein